MTVFVILWSTISWTLHDFYCLYSLSQAILKLSLSARGHFVTLIENNMHLISCNPGVNVIKVLHLYFTRVAIVSFAENNSCTCKLQV